MDSGCAASSLSPSQGLFIAQQNLFCCGSDAEPERGLGAAGGRTCGSQWVLGHVRTPLPPNTPHGGSLLPPWSPSCGARLWLRAWGG